MRSFYTRYGGCRWVKKYQEQIPIFLIFIFCRKYVVFHPTRATFELKDKRFSKYFVYV